MTVHFFTKGDINVGSSRQRAFLVAEEMRQRGWQAEVKKPYVNQISAVKWPKKAKLIFQLIKVLWQAKKGDIFYVHKGTGNKYFLILLWFCRKICRRRIVCDFDDAIYLHSPWKTKFLVKMSDLVIVGSHALKDWVSQYHNKIYLIPTSVNFDIYSQFSHDYQKENQPLIIGWVGHGPSHLPNLKLLAPVFEKLLEQGIDFKFTLVGSLENEEVKNTFRQIKGLKVNFIDRLDWGDVSNIAREIQKFDVGLMPLLDTPFERGKCAFKAVEYMACAVPSVLSSVGENNYLIQQSQNGFLAKATNDWAATISRLLADENLRKKIGLNGQETIKQHYSFFVTVPYQMQIIANNFVK